jgi:hypothetical protein
VSWFGRRVKAQRTDGRAAQSHRTAHHTVHLPRIMSTKGKHSLPAHIPTPYTNLVQIYISENSPDIYPAWVFRIDGTKVDASANLYRVAIREYDAKQLVSYWLNRSPTPIPTVTESSLAPVRVAQVE